MTETKTSYELLEDGNWDELLRSLDKQPVRTTRGFLHNPRLFDAPENVVGRICELNPDELLESFVVQGTEQYMYPLFIALENPRVDAEVIREILEVNPRTAYLIDDGGLCALHIACRGKLEHSHEIIRLLLEVHHGGTFVRDSIYYFYPIHYAIQNKTISIETIQMLVNTNPLSLREIETSPGRAFTTLLYFLCCNGDRPQFCQLAKILLMSYPEAAAIKNTEYPFQPAVLPIHRLVFHFHTARQLELEFIEEAFLLLAQAFPESLIDIGASTDLLPFTYLTSILFRGRFSEFRASRHLWDQMALLKPEALYTIGHETPLSILVTTAYNERSILNDVELYILKLHWDVIRENIRSHYSSLNCETPFQMISFCHRLFHPSDLKEIFAKILENDKDAGLYQDTIFRNNPLHVLCTAPVLPSIPHQTVTHVIVPNISDTTESHPDFEVSNVTPMESILTSLSNQELVVMQKNLFGELPLHLFLKYASRDLVDPDRNERDLVLLSSACDQSSGTIEPTTSLYPFMLAAVKKVIPSHEWSITVVYKLLNQFVAVRNMMMIDTNQNDIRSIGNKRQRYSH